MFLKKGKWQAQIAKTGFLTSLVSYVTFWLFDTIRSGFVARYFSVHIFLFFSLVFGYWWSISVRTYQDRPKIQLLVAVAFGIFLSMIIWLTGEGLGTNRFFVSLLGLIIPLFFLGLLRSK